MIFLYAVASLFCFLDVIGQLVRRGLRAQHTLHISRGTPCLSPIGLTSLSIIPVLQKYDSLVDALIG